MSQQEIKIDWMEKMAFRSEVNGHELILDAVPEAGGEDRGPRPKPLAMVALAGCTGMDVVSILRKMRVNPDSFSVRVIGDLSDEHPKIFTGMHVIYEFRGKDLPLEKLEKAVRLSEEQYCGVSLTYRKAMGITSEIRILD